MLRLEDVSFFGHWLETVIRFPSFTSHPFFNVSVTMGLIQFGIQFIWMDVMIRAMIFNVDKLNPQQQDFSFSLISLYNTKWRLVLILMIMMTECEATLFS